MTPFAVTTTSDGTAATLTVDGELDLATVAQLDAALEQVQANGSTMLCLDLAKVRFMDSTGLRCLLRARRRAQDDGRRLLLTNLPSGVERLFEVTGVGRVFEITPTV
jgi:anti-sigma B factor antagonist